MYLFFISGNHFTLSLLRDASKQRQITTSDRCCFADFFALFFLSGWPVLAEKVKCSPIYVSNLVNLSQSDVKLQFFKLSAFYPEVRSIVAWLRSKSGELLLALKTLDLRPFLPRSEVKFASEVRSNHKRYQRCPWPKTNIILSGVEASRQA